MRADASTLHGADLPAIAAVHRLEITRAAVVLGSTQSNDVVDVDEVRTRGADLVCRRSGGGVVVLGIDDHLWVDIVVPRDHPLWDDDVARAAWWVGEAWCAALGAAGVPGVLDVHRDGPQLPPQERALCFFDLGAGEVTRDGRKLVGVSQRRTRHAARFQCVAYRRFDPAEHLGVLRGAPTWPATQDVAELGEIEPDRVWQELRGVVNRRLAGPMGRSGEPWGKMWRKVGRNG
jgi:lipoate-protein ligase A